MYQSLHIQIQWSLDCCFLDGEIQYVLYSNYKLIIFEITGHLRSKPHHRKWSKHKKPFISVPVRARAILNVFSDHLAYANNTSCPRYWNICSDNKYGQTYLLSEQTVLVIGTYVTYSLSELKADIGTNCSDNEYRTRTRYRNICSDNEYERIYLSEQSVCSDNESYSL